MEELVYFGAYHPEYMRNRIIRKGLSRLGYEVRECRTSPRSGSLRCYWNLIRAWRALGAHGLRFLMVPEFNQRVVPLAFLISRLHGVPLVYDHFVPVYHAAVHERGVFRPASVSAFLYRMLDKVALRLADAILVDTALHRELAANESGIDPARIFLVPVGSDDELFHPRPGGSDKATFEVLFWGKYAPLHGVDLILEAAHRLDSVASIHFTLVGEGQLKDEMLRLASELGSTNVRFLPNLPLEELPERMAAADLCLGIFGGTEQASRVVPNKVYAALAMAKPVITGDSDAVREFFENEKHLLLVPMKNDKALAEAILRLKDDSDLRHRLAEEGYRELKDKFSVDSIGRRMSEVLSALAKRQS